MKGMVRLLAVALSAVLLTACGKEDVAASQAAGPVVGELAYWKEGETARARVLKYGEDGVQVLEAEQTDLPFKGILITRVVFPECGTLKFQRNDLGGLYGTGVAEEGEKYAGCPIKDWKGVWRIGNLM